MYSSCSMLAHRGYQYQEFDSMNISNGLGKINPQGYIHKHRLIVVQILSLE